MYGVPFSRIIFYGMMAVSLSTLSHHFPCGVSCQTLLFNKGLLCHGNAQPNASSSTLDVSNPK